MNVRDATTRSRRAAAHLHTDSCTIDRRDGTTVRNETTGDDDPNYTVIYASRPCRIQQDTAVPLEDQGAGRTVITQRYELQLPWDTTGVQVDDRVVVNTCLSAPDLVGRTFRVAALHHKSHASSVRVSLEETVT